MSLKEFDEDLAVGLRDILLEADSDIPSDGVGPHNTEKVANSGSDLELANNVGSLKEASDMRVQCLEAFQSHSGAVISSNT